MLLWEYLKRNLKLIIMLALFMLVFCIVLRLYGLMLEAVLYAALLCLAIGVVLFAVGFSRFVRYHHRLKDQLERVRDTLEPLPPPKDLIERDYQALVEALVRERARAASEADRAKSDMTDYYTLWAHQIKTPIAALRLLLQGKDGDGREEALSSEVFKIEQYVDMALQYLRLDSDTSDYVLRVCDLDEIVRGAVRKYARLFILKKLRFDFEPTGRVIVTDEKWLSFVLEQLLSNALKYTNEGAIAIRGDGDDLFISDTGIGVAPEDLPRVFERGFTGYNGRADRKSTGIGLYLCDAVCRRLGHGIAMESVAGQGTTVRLTLSRHIPDPTVE